MKLGNSKRILLFPACQKIFRDNDKQINISPKKNRLHTNGANTISWFVTRLYRNLNWKL